MTSPAFITDTQLAEKLDASPAPRVTKEQIDERISEVKFHQFGILTHCTIHLDNKYQVTGESACVNPENYNREIGEKIAYDNAYQKLWSLFGFLLAEHNFTSLDKQAA